jgi:site-specific DNA-methyltransferase (adenine-specific)
MIQPYYDDGKDIQIYLGDCREILPHLKADVIVTDPPYGIGFAAQPTTGQRRRKQKKEQWDNQTLPEVILSLHEKAKVIAIWGGNYYPLPISRGWLSWYKPDAPPSMGQFELCWTNQDQNTKQIIQSIAATNKERIGHPTQKPLRVMRWTIQQLSIPMDAVILDPFMGSGTTLRAAKDLGFQAIGIEISEKYAEIAAQRLSQEVLALEQV